MLCFTYSELVDRFGEPTASQCLAEIEKAAGIKPQLASTDSEARLAYAIALQDDLIHQQRMAA